MDCRLCTGAKFKLLCYIFNCAAVAAITYARLTFLRFVQKSKKEGKLKGGVGVGGEG